MAYQPDLDLLAIQASAKPGDSRAPVTVERVRELLDYDPETGEFRWRQSLGSRKAGDIAGYRKPGEYSRIQIDGKMLLLHRVAWLYVHGVWPKDQIDHINLEKSDNRLVNLREATRALNSANTRKPSTNSSGHKGVRLKRGRWNAQIKVSGKFLFLGSFADPIAAQQAYKSAAEKYFGDFLRTE